MHIHIYTFSNYVRVYIIKTYLHNFLFRLFRFFSRVFYKANAKAKKQQSTLSLSYSRTISSATHRSDVRTFSNIAIYVCIATQYMHTHTHPFYAIFVRLLRNAILCRVVGTRHNIPYNRLSLCLRFPVLRNAIKIAQL